MANIELTSQVYLLITPEPDTPYPVGVIYNDDEDIPEGVIKTDKIVAGTLHLDELLCDGDLQFGQICATRFEVTLYDTLAIGGKCISVYLEDTDAYDETVTTLLFTGIVQSAKLDRLNTTTDVIAYDYAYATSKINVASWWTSYWANLANSPVGNVRSSLLNYVGITYDNTVSLINDNELVTKTVDITSISFIEMLKALCEMSCCFPHFDRSGILRFIMLDPTDTATSLDGLYEGDNSTFEDYTTQAITGIQFYGNSSDLKYIEGTSLNPYTIQSNIFLYNKTASEYHTMGEDMLDYMETITYRPSSVKMIVSDFSIQLGDKVSTDKGAFYVLHNTLEGVQFIEQTLEQSGQEVNDEVSVETNISEAFTNEDIKEIEKLQSSEIAFSRNSVPITIADGGQAVIANITYSANEGEIVLFHEEVSATIQATVEETDTHFVIHEPQLLVEYYVNGRKLANRQSLGDVVEGKTIISLMQFWESGMQTNSRLQAFLRPTGCSVSIAREQASAYIIIREAELLEFELVVTSEPTKTEYYVTQPLDYSGLVVEKVYYDTSIPSVDVTSLCTLSPVAGTTYATEQEIECVVTYSEVNEVGEVKYWNTTFYCEWVEPEELFEIQITTEPTKTEYGLGDTIDYTGIVVQKVYFDGVTPSEDITSQCTFTPESGTVLTTEGTVEYTVDYYEQDEVGRLIHYSTESDVEVCGFEIEVTTEPTKTLYGIGDTIDYTGLVVTKTFDSTTLQPVNITNDCVITPASGTTTATAGTTTCQVTYTYLGTAYTDSFDIEFSDYTIEVHAMPTKTVYSPGEIISYTGLSIYKVFDDSDLPSVDITSNCTFSPASGTTVSQAQSGSAISCTVTYTQNIAGTTVTKTASFNVQCVTYTLQVTNNPDKTVYRPGDTLDYTGLEVYKVSDNPNVESIDVTSQCTLSPASGTTISQAQSGSTITCNVSYTESGTTMSTSFGVECVSYTLQVTSMPTKTSYRTGEAIDYAGLAIVKVSDNPNIPSSNVTSQCTIVPSSGTIVTSSEGATITCNVTYYDYDESTQYTTSFTLTHDTSVSLDYIEYTLDAQAGKMYVTGLKGNNIAADQPTEVIIPTHFELEGVTYDTVIC